MKIITSVALAGCAPRPRARRRPEHHPHAIGSHGPHVRVDGRAVPDGRPRVPDALLERMKKVGLEEAWAVLRNKGFEWQYEGRFRLVHLDQTATMVGGPSPRRSCPSGRTSTRP